MNAMRSPVHILGVGVIAPGGIGLSAFRDSLRQDWDAESTPSQLKFAGEGLPQVSARALTDFEPKAHLGSKGLSSMDRTTQFTVIGTDLALKDAGYVSGDRNDAEIGVVLGSASGCIRSISDFAYSTYASNPPYTVSAMAFPNTVMNSAAGQCAIRHRLKGINSTICAGSLSSMMAFRYSTLMLRLGRASVLLSGGVEEYCSWSTWSHYSRHATTGAPPVGEGCAMFALSTDRECSTEPCYGEFLACTVESTRAPRTDMAAKASAFGRSLRSTLGRAGITASDLTWWAPQSSPIHGLEGAIELQEMERLLSPGAIGKGVTHIDSVRHNGDVFSAGAAFQLATAIAFGMRGPGLITGISSDGQVGCLAVNLEQPV